MVAPFNGLDRQIVQLGHGSRGCRSSRRRIPSDPIFEVPPGQDQILIADGVDDIRGAKTFRLQRLCIQVDLNLSLLAAVQVRNGRSGNRNELRADEVRADVVQAAVR